MPVATRKPGKLGAKQKSEIEYSSLEMHQGQVLFRAASTYSTLEGVTLELVQNAIDSEATDIWVIIDIPKRTIVVRDNGEGANVDKLNRSLRSIGVSLKVAQKDKLGRFGLGLISALGKCEKFVFTSTPKTDSRGFNEWEFDSEEILEQESNLLIPRIERRDLNFSRDPKRPNEVQWRSQMKIMNFRKDLRLVRLTSESLTEDIQDRFSVAMNRHNVSIHATLTDQDKLRETWEIKALEFRGVRLPIFRHTTKQGISTFDLYIAPKSNGKKGGRQGKVLIKEEHNDYRLDLALFAETTAKGILPEEVATLLSSGTFEGVISHSKIVLKEDRRSFEVTDALVDLCLGMEVWAKEIGSAHADEVKTSRKKEGYQILGARSMKAIESVVLNNSTLSGVVKSFKRGTVGENHAEGASVLGKQDKSSISAITAASKSPNGGSERDYSNKNRPAQTTLPEHHPFTVQGPKGHKRNIVKSDSLGLQLVFDEDGTSKRLWDLDTAHGIMVFNTRHPLWSEAEAGGAGALMQFQEIVTIRALYIEATPEEWRPQFRDFTEEELEGIVSLLTSGDALAGRKRMISDNPLK